ncbi:dioxygenase [Streptomyces sp. NPDC001508]|uniref:dioxygenase n=1 Tax=Streptomyces sp. NPDC001508 TaxID=3154656 RepID=UPI003323ACD1
MTGVRGTLVPRGRSLRTRLVVFLSVMLVLVCGAMAAATAIVQRDFLMRDLDERVTEAAERSQGALDQYAGDTRNLGFLRIRGQTAGTLAARLDADGDVVAAAVVADDGHQRPLSTAQRTALEDVPADGKPHTLTVLTIKVIDSETCKPVRNAAVDIWHCDALGVYSGYESLGSSLGGGMPSGTPTGTPTAVPTDGGGAGMHQEPTDDKRYLRGTWRTDHQGKARFTTIFPGWYQGRAVHIHTKVHVDGKWTKNGYEGGHTCHTGQFYFEEEAVLAAAELKPYSTSTVTRTTLTEDIIYDQSGATGGLLTLRYDKKKIAKGVAASITVGVDPEATHDGDDATVPGIPASPSASS